jgi:hypothetical protein
MLTNWARLCRGLAETASILRDFLSIAGDSKQTSCIWRHSKLIEYLHALDFSDLFGYFLFYMNSL